MKKAKMCSARVNPGNTPCAGRVSHCATNGKELFRTLIKTCKVRIFQSNFVDFGHYVCYPWDELNTLANICLESWPKCLYRGAV